MPLYIEARKLRAVLYVLVDPRCLLAVEYTECRVVEHDDVRRDVEVIEHCVGILWIEAGFAQAVGELAYYI